MSRSTEGKEEQRYEEDFEEETASAVSRNTVQQRFATANDSSSHGQSGEEERKVPALDLENKLSISMPRPQTPDNSNLASHRPSDQAANDSHSPSDRTAYSYHAEDRLNLESNRESPARSQDIPPYSESRHDYTLAERQSPNGRRQSPTTQQRLHQRVQDQMCYEVSSWTVTEVCDWVEEVGLGQYRRRFLHHCIDGNLLLRLTGHELKEDLGIGPLGHRDGLLQAICDLQHHFQQRASRGQGHMPRVASRHSHIGRHRHGQSLAWNGHISSGNIPEARPGTAPVGRPQTAGPEVGVKVTQWRDHLARDLERALARAERRRMAAGAAAHTCELAEDAMRLKTKTENVCAQQRQTDPLSTQRRAERDLAFLRQQLGLGNEVTPEAACEQVLEAEAERGQEEGASKDVLKPRQIEAVRRLPLQRRISRVAGILRTQQFMQRYHADLNTRDARMHELESRWLKLLNPSLDTEAREVHDFEGGKRHFETCGWPLSDFHSSSTTALGADDKLDALIARSQALKAAQERAELLHKSVDPNWSLHLRHDGLDELQAARIQEGLRRAQERACSPKHSRRPKTAPSMPVTPGRAIEEPALRPGGAHDPRNPLEWTIDMLAACSSADLDRLISLKGSKKCIAMQRTLTSRRFINFTREDLEKRRVKYEEAMRALQPQHKQLSKAQIDAFFERLIVDSESRGRKRQELVKQAHEKEITKMLEAQQALAATLHEHATAKRPKARTART
ncbi:hypothetical protein WJX84_003868 [Apatococcus fuscideae]|uniref:SAM domain-containing protein n=1 Tax=Apatococcus fuscideae TaxID=2026836 RepID=A0AAW1TG94_9CHLO